MRCGRFGSSGLRCGVRQCHQIGQRLAHGLGCGFDGFGCDLGRSLGTRCGRRLGRCGGGLGGHHGGFGGQATRHAQFIGPDRHRRQLGLFVLGRGLRQRQGRLKRVPDHQQLLARVFQLGRELGVHADPVGIAREFGGLALPVRHVGAQRVQGRGGIAPGLGRQHFDALGQQHSGFALHLHAVLQIFNDLDAFGQLALKHRQRLARQRGAGLGGVALPGGGVGDVERLGGQQLARLLGPFDADFLLGFQAADFIQTLAHGARCALVAHAEFLEHFLQLVVCGLGREPVANARSTLTRGFCGKRAAGQRIKRMRFRGLGQGRVHFRGVGHVATRGKRGHCSMR